MFASGHLGIAMVVYAVVAVVVVSKGGRPSVLGFGTLVGASLAPDADIYLAGLPHRGPTHTVWAAVALAVVVWLGVRSLPVTPPADTRPATLGAVGVLSHLLGDVVTPMGIAPFAPVSSYRFTLNLVLSRNPDANALLFAAGITSVLAVGIWSATRDSVPDQSADANDPTTLPPSKSRAGR